jgi:hypothetical protein
MAAPPVVRTDGRKPAMMRQLKTERDPLERAHGSARWEQGTHLTVVAPPSFIPEVLPLIDANAQLCRHPRHPHGRNGGAAAEA